MLLALDIGNSEIKTGIWNGKRWVKQSRQDTHPVLTEQAYHTIFKQILNEISIGVSDIHCVAVASVVPSVSEIITTALNSLFGFEALLINAAIDSGIKVETDCPEQAGADLIAGTVAACQLTKDACIVVDCGTATTLMVAETTGVLLGGAICTGLKTSINALIGGTAQLQQIPLEVPSSPVGQNTVHAMQSGLVSGHLAMIEGLIDRMRNEIGPAKVVATGGLIPVLADHTDYFDYVEPTLVLDGIRLIAERQQ